MKCTTRLPLILTQLPFPYSDAKASPLPLRPTGSSGIYRTGSTGELFHSVKSAGRRFMNSVTNSVKGFARRYKVAAAEHKASAYVPHSHSGPGARWYDNAQYL